MDEPDPKTNTQQVTLTVPDHVDPMVAKQMLSKIEKESK